MSDVRFFLASMTAEEPMRMALWDKLESRMKTLAGWDLVVGTHHLINSAWKTEGGLRPVITCLREAAQFAGECYATHVVLLCEDMILHPDFFTALKNVASSRPDDVVCCQINHPMAAGVSRAEGIPGYTTYDGATLLGGMMSLENLRAFLKWDIINAHTLGDYPIDERVNLWAMDTRRLIYKPLPALVDHDLTVPSLQGNQYQTATGCAIRNSLGFDPEKPIPTGLNHWQDVPCLGGTYDPSKHIALLERLAPPRVAQYLDVVRNHGLSGKKSLFIAAPAFHGDVKFDWMVSVLKEIMHLKDSGIDTTVATKADSLINRGRNRLVTDFLLSDATHMLMWDTDNLPTEPGWVKVLMDSDLDVCGGAVVLKDGTGTKFAVDMGFEGEGTIAVEKGFWPVEMLGTAFLMVTRKAIMQMIEAYPETYYRAGRGMEEPGRAEWHLFADVVRDRHHLSEDFEFCKRWKALGGKVYLRPEIDFVHYGQMPFFGSFSKVFKGESDAAQQRDQQENHLGQHQEGSRGGQAAEAGGSHCAQRSA